MTKQPFRSLCLYFAGVLLILVFSADYANAQTFTATGSMAEPLICQTSTALRDSTVLITGGTNLNYFNSGVDATKDAELYDPSLSSPSFEPIGQMNVARNCGSNATLLNDGTVLITGGSGNTTAELYNPSSRSFSLTTPPGVLHPQGLPIGPMNAVRHHATATLLQDGTVLIAGGDIGDNAGLTTAEIYNPATGSFTPTTGMMSTKRTTQTATLLADGTVLIAGGQGNVSGQMAWNTAEIYNPATKQFTKVSGLMTTNRAEHTANLLSDGTVLLAGGLNNSGVISSAEIYSPSTSTFTATGSLNSARMEHTATSIANGTVLITGGFSSNSSSNALNSAETYNPVQHSFTLTGNMTVPRAFHSATMLFNGNVLIAGGLEGNGNPNAYLSSAELYSYTVTTAIMGPAYKVTSIIYAPPGNKSQDGYTNNTSDATTTSIGSSFTSGHTITTTFGFSVAGIGGITASQSFGTSSTSSNMAAFQESFTNATGVANQSNSNAPDAINHNNDLFLIWLNPQVIAFGDATAQGPAGYSVGVRSLPDGTTPLPDIVEVNASAMEANSAGMTTVPASTLNQEPNESGKLVPGLASICKNLIKAEYAAQTCSLQDQCGCTANDFLPILQQDPLLFFQGLSNPITPYPATTSPLTANVSDAQICGVLPVVPGGDCRYVPVPSGIGSTEQEGVTLQGPDTSGGNNPINSFQQGENNQTTYTLGGQTQTQVNQSISINLSVPTGNLGANGPSGTGTGTWGVGQTMTWTDMQSVANGSSSGTTLAVSLSSSTVGCAQNGNIGVFEDTVYHTFVFQQPPGDPSTCTALAPGFYVKATPNNPSQTVLSLGHSTSYTILVSGWNGFNGTVALVANGLPAGLTANFSPASITTSGVGTATLTLTAAYSNATFVGNSTITVTGTSGNVTQSAVFPLVTQPLQYRGSCNVQ